MGRVNITPEYRAKMSAVKKGVYFGENACYKGTIEKPIIGDIRYGRDLGKRNTGLFQFVTCTYCGKEHWTNYYLKRHCVGTYRCYGTCCQKGKRQIHGAQSKLWRGGRHYTPEGYINLSIFENDPFYSMGTSGVGQTHHILEHRYVMAKYLGRCLTKNECVHHKNGIRDDNRIENLELTLRGKHSKDHNKGYQDGFNKGYNDGQSEQIQELKSLIEEQTKWIKLLLWHVNDKEKYGDIVHNA